MVQSLRCGGLPTSGYAFLACLLFSLSTSGAACSNQLFVPGNLRESCPGDVLTFNCAIVGGGVTIWRGTAFNCPTRGNEILLRHSQFAGGNAVGSCNGGTISAQASQNTTNMCFTSHLSVTISNQLNNKTIECAHDSGSQQTIDVVTIVVLTAQYQPISFLQLSEIIDPPALALVFTWNQLGPNLPGVNYRVQATNCGDCPDITNSTTVTCSNVWVSPSGLQCTFNIQSVVCGQEVNSMANPAVVNLKVPDVPDVRIVPVYMNDTGKLTKIVVNILEEATFAISDGFDGSVEMFTVSFLQNGLCHSSNVPASCTNSVCRQVFDLSRALSSCDPSTETAVTVSATNRLGTGPSTAVFNISGTKFVSVVFYPESNILACTFDIEDNSEKSCSVSYGPNFQMLETTQNKSNTSIVTVALDLMIGTNYVYIVTASNATDSLQLEGSLTIQIQGNDIAAVIGGIIVALIFVVFLVSIVVTVVFCHWNKKSANLKVIYKHEQSNSDSTTSINKGYPNFVSLEVQQSDVQTDAECYDQRFEMLNVTEDCELKEFIKSSHYCFQRGCAFYEFTHEVERICENQEIVLITCEKGEFNGKYEVGDSEVRKSMGVPGEAVKKPTNLLKDYRVFVQSWGSGGRHLEKGSAVLYQKSTTATDQIDTSKASDGSLIPIDRTPFQLNHVAFDRDLKTFCKNHELDLDRDDVFLELNEESAKATISDIYDAIIMKSPPNGKVEFFTGPGAHHIASSSLRKLKSRDISDVSNKSQQNGGIDQNQRVFVSGKFKDSMCLKEGTAVLRSNPLSPDKSFILLKVDQDSNNVQMSKFVNIKHGAFENGMVYYEFTRDEEDIPEGTEIVLIKKGAADEEPEFYTGPNAFFRIPGVPGIRIKRPKLRSYRVFVQSKSQGSRCLKANANILIKVKKVKHSEHPPLGSQAPTWVRDEDVSACQLCVVKFTLFTRRHHCRSCGKIFCDDCSKCEVQLQYTNKPERVCKMCYNQLSTQVPALKSD